MDQTNTLQGAYIIKEAPNGEKHLHYIDLLQSASRPFTSVGSQMMIPFKRPQQEASDQGPSKIFRKDNEQPTKQLDLSEFPVEILLLIFDYLKADDRCVKPLMRTCTTFRDILIPRLRLRLDFNRIFKTKRYPDIKRGYSNIEFYGFEIDSNIFAISKALESSREFATKLSFTSDNKNRCRINLFAFILILKQLPFIKELTVSTILVLEPRLKFDRSKIKEEHYPELLHLRKLTLDNVGGPFDDALKKLTGLEELVVPFDAGKLSIPIREKMMELIESQERLKKLETKTHLKLRTISSLETFIFGKAMYDYYGGLTTTGNLFKFTPKLKEVKITEEADDAVQIITQSSSKTIETIEIEGPVSSTFTVQSILLKYPSLKVFKSRYVNWKKA